MYDSDIEAKAVCKNIINSLETEWLTIHSRDASIPDNEKKKLASLFTASIDETPFGRTLKLDFHNEPASGSSISSIINGLENLSKLIRQDGIIVIELRNLKIEKDAIFLDNITFSFDLSFQNCAIFVGLSAVSSNLLSLRITNSTLGFIDLRRSVFGGELNFSQDTTVHDKLILSGSVVHGNFHVHSVNFANDRNDQELSQVSYRYNDNATLIADGACFKGHSIIGPFVNIIQGIILAGSIFERDFVIMSTRCDSINRYSVMANNSKFGGNVLICDVGARDTIHVKNLASYSECEFGNNVFHGAINLSSSNIEGDLVLSGTHISYSPKYQLPYDEMQFSRHVHDKISEDTKTELDGFSTRAFIAEGASIRGRVYFDHGFQAVGSISLTNAKIDQDISLDGGSVLAVSEVALYFGGLRSGGSLFLGDNRNEDMAFQCWGLINMAHIEVAEDTNFRGTRFLGGVKSFGIDLHAAKIHGTLYMPASYEALYLSKEQRHFSKTGINDYTIRRFTFSARNAIAGVLKDNDGNDWPPKGAIIDLNGFRYGLVDLKGGSFKGRLHVVSRFHGDAHMFKPQPFTHLAEQFFKAGLENESKDVLIKRERLSLDALIHDWKYYPQEWKNRKSEWLNDSFKMRITFYGNFYRLLFISIIRIFSIHIWKGVFRFVGFGYKPIRIIPIMFGCFVILRVVLGFFPNEEIFVPRDSRIFTNNDYKDDGRIPPQYVPFNLNVYCVDVLLPIVDLNMHQNWMIGTVPNSNIDPKILSSLRYLVRFYILLGWFLTTLFAAAFTGLLKR